LLPTDQWADPPAGSTAPSQVDKIVKAFGGKTPKDTAAAIRSVVVDNSQYDPISVLSAPADTYELITEKCDVANARRQEMLAAVAVLREKIKTGSFPNELPALFIDPFSGKQLIYKHNGDGFSIYSVGPSGVFDGVKKQGAGSDTVFVYPAPPTIPVPSNLLESVDTLVKQQGR
jgi:hypothetical protein